MDNDGFGWKIFAGVMILIGGTFNLIDGLVGLTNASYFQNAVSGVSGSRASTAQGLQFPVTNDIKTWSWVILVVGAVMILAGFLIFVGSMFGRIVGVIAASVNILLQLSYSNHSPWWAFTMVIIDILVIYGLIAHGGKLSDDWMDTTT
jgi:hypothetical protein